MATSPGRFDLTPLMNPRSIAVVGASQRVARGTRTVANLQRYGYEGAIYPINPRYDEVLGLPCYPDLAATPEPADCVIIAIPAEHVVGVVEQAVNAGVRAATILSSGFSEAGPAGRERYAALERLAHEHRFPICGPNCYGVFNLRDRIAAFTGEVPQPLRVGPVSLVSQSGGTTNVIGTPLMEDRQVGFSYLVSCGNQAGVSVEDYLEFLVEDEGTRIIGAFVEGFKQPAKLRAVAERAAAQRKPIVMMKVGRSENARQATLAHTGSLAGTPEIVEALLRQCGIVQVASLNELIETVALFARTLDYRGGYRLAVVSGSGGECGRAADVAADLGIDLPPLAPATVERLQSFLPDFATPRNPLDGTGAMYESPPVFGQILETVLADENTDALLVGMPAGAPRPSGRAPGRQFAPIAREVLARGTDCLVVAFGAVSLGALDDEVVRTLAEVGVPYLQGTETALQAIQHLQEHRAFLERAAARRPNGAPSAPGPGTLPAGSGLLPTADAGRLLAEWGIPVVPTVPAASAEAAVVAAERLGYPVALKIDSPDVAHKSDVGGVRLGLADAAAARAAYDDLLAEVARHLPGARLDGVLVQPQVADGAEVILGIKSDPLFGPAVVCGLGGVFVEVLRDVAIRLPPLDLDDAREMIAGLRGSALLRGVRGRPPADVAALARAIVRLGAFAAAAGPRLAALDVNPLLVLPEGRGVVAVDWLVELAPAPDDR